MGLGHRRVLRAADVVVEAWADSREECLAEAVQALMECCVRVDDVVPDACVMIVLSGETDEALLVAVLDEVIHQIEANGRVTVDVSVDERTVAAKGQVEVRLATVPVEAVERVGTAPATVAVHGVRFGCVDGVWRARLQLDHGQGGSKHLQDAAQVGLRCSTSTLLPGPRLARAAPEPCPGPGQDPQRTGPTPRSATTSRTRSTSTTATPPPSATSAPPS
jgi:SHS2 domain-containing protein